MARRKSEHWISRATYSDMSVEQLTFYLIEIRYPYLKEAAEVLYFCIRQIESDQKIKGHKKLSAAISRLARLITSHLQYEENVYFPLLKQYLINKTKHTPRLEKVHLRIIKEHEGLKKQVERIRLCTDNFKLNSSSPLGKLCLAQLFNFEQDLLRNIFLEEEILIPKLIGKHH